MVLEKGGSRKFSKKKGTHLRALWWQQVVFERVFVAGLELVVSWQVPHDFNAAKRGLG